MWGLGFGAKRSKIGAIWGGLGFGFKALGCLGFNIQGGCRGGIEKGSYRESRGFETY